jgi:hypothetical protein
MQEETEKQRVNRELIELLTELRVALPGVQVLFAFLLTIPFTRGWPSTTRLERDVFFLALLSAVASTAFLMAPSAYHRILFRAPNKERMLLHANRLAVVGLAALAVSLASSVFLVAHFVFGSIAAGIATGLSTALVATIWYALPLWLRLRR